MSKKVETTQVTDFVRSMLEFGMGKADLSSPENYALYLTDFVNIWNTYSCILGGGSDRLTKTTNADGTYDTSDLQLFSIDAVTKDENKEIINAPSKEAFLTSGYNNYYYFDNNSQILYFNFKAAIEFTAFVTYFPPKLGIDNDLKITPDSFDRRFGEMLQKSCATLVLSCMYLKYNLDPPEHILTLYKKLTGIDFDARIANRSMTNTPLKVHN